MNACQPCPVQLQRVTVLLCFGAKQAGVALHLIRRFALIGISKARCLLALVLSRAWRFLNALMSRMLKMLMFTQARLVFMPMHTSSYRVMLG